MVSSSNDVHRREQFVYWLANDKNVLHAVNNIHAMADFVPVHEGKHSTPKRFKAVVKWFVYLLRPRKSHKTLCLSPMQRTAHLQTEVPFPGVARKLSSC